MKKQIVCMMNTNEEIDLRRSITSICKCVKIGYFKNTEEYTTTEIIDLGVAEEAVKLGKKEYFVLGDDRQNSEDSRVANIGNVKRTEIKGKVWFVIAPKDNFGFVK